MGVLAETTRNAALDGVFTQLGLSSVYVAALVGGVEVSGNNYARAELTVANIGAAASGVRANTAVVTFPAASGSWGTIDEIRLYSALSGGTQLAADTGITPVAVDASKRLTLDVGELTLTIADA